MKKIIVLLILTINILPVIKQGKMTTTGEVMAQSMGDEYCISCNNMLPEVTIEPSNNNYQPFIPPNIDPYPIVSTNTPTPTYDPCAYGGCEGSGKSSGSTVNQPKNNTTPTNKPTEVDCNSTDIKNANAAMNTLNVIKYAPDAINANKTPPYPQPNMIMPFLNAFANTNLVEAGFSISYNKQNLYYRSEPVTGKARSIDIPTTDLTKILIHCHPPQITGQPTTGPSPQDFVSLVTGRFQYGNTIMSDSYVVAYGGATYALSITNTSAAKTFFDQNKSNLASDPNTGLFATGTRFDDDYKAMNAYLISKKFSVADAYDAAMAYVLDKHNTGISLLKQEKSGDAFKAIHTSGSMNSNKKITSANSTKCK